MSDNLPMLMDNQIALKIRRGYKKWAFFENNLLLSRTLHQESIPNILHLLDCEAHKAKYWGELLKIYL